MRTNIALLFSAIVAGVDASALGIGATMAGSFLPPELRGISGTIAAAAMAKTFAAKGIVDFATDGSDYPYVCLCATPDQLKQLSAAGTPVKDPTKCPEKQDMGCQKPQGDMSLAPLPVITTAK